MRIRALLVVVSLAQGCATPAAERPFLEQLREAGFDDPEPADEPRALQLLLGDRRGFRGPLLDEVRRIFARRLDVASLPWWTRVTVWIDDGVVVAAEVPRGGLEAEPLFAAAVEVGGKRAFYDAEGRSLEGPFLSRPVEDAEITSRRGMRLHPILNRWRFHDGTDYAAEPGAPVVSLGDGVVRRIGRDRVRGLFIVVRHDNGMEMRFMHLRGVAPRVVKNRRVRRGQVIGYVGRSGMATGPHLHFEVRWKRRSLDPVGLEWPAGPPLPPELHQAHADNVERLKALRDRTLVDAGRASAPPRG